MSKAVLMSIQPYWVFLIIAKAIGWNISKEKTVEVRKSFPKDESWNKVVKIYCSKDKKSFAKIPKEYQPFMKPLLGKVPGEFVCDCIGDYWFSEDDTDIEEFEDVQMSCLSAKEIIEYGDDKTLHLWNISDLKIYDKPRELSEFIKTEKCPYAGMVNCKKCVLHHCLTRPPQSWCYVEEKE